MKKSLNKKTLCLTAAALTLTAGVSVGSAMAYFTTYTQAQGGATLDLGFTVTDPDEEMSDWTKHITIANNGDQDCYVRVKAFAGEKYQDGLTYSGENWTQASDGYYYYSKVVEAGKSTEDVLDIHIDNTDAEEDFNVIVVQECAPVLYDEAGNPTGGDWDNVLDSSQGVYQADEEVGE